MISLLGPFAWKASPFSPSRFVLFMAVLAGISAVSIAAEQRAPNQGRTASTPAAPAESEATIVRFPQPMQDTYGDLRQIGLPWFLRRQGVTADVDTQGTAEIDVAMTYQGRPIGKYIERLVALDADRSKLYVTFVPQDMDLVVRFAAPIQTRLDPATLMRVVMAEHIRSSVNGGGFDMRVLTETPGSRWSVFRKAFGDSGLCENPQTDDFQCASADRDANIRRAYRAEAARRASR